MAIKFFDGCGLYKSGSELSGTLVPLSADWELAAGRFGGACMSAYDGDAWNLYAPTPNGVACFVGASMSFPKTVYDYPLYTFVGSGGSTLARVSRTQSGRLTIVDKAGAVRQTSVPCFSLVKWFRIEIKFIGDQTNGSLVVRVNGIEVLNVSGLDTANGGAETLDHVTFNAPRFNTGNTFWDDIVWWDDTGTENNDFLGDLRIDELLPTANGTDQSWTANAGDAFAAIDDAVKSYDDDTTYIAASTVGARSNFAMSDLATPSDKILAVQVRPRVKKSDAGDTTMKTYVSSGGTDAEDAAQPPSTNYAFLYGGFHTVDPATAAEWDDAGVNGMSAGVIIAS